VKSSVVVLDSLQRFGVTPVGSLKTA